MTQSAAAAAAAVSRRRGDHTQSRRIAERRCLDGSLCSPVPVQRPASPVHARPTAGHCMLSAAGLAAACGCTAAPHEVCWHLAAAPRPCRHPCCCRAVHVALRSWEWGAGTALAPPPCSLDPKALVHAPAAKCPAGSGATTAEMTAEAGAAGSGRSGWKWTIAECPMGGCRAAMRNRDRRGIPATCG